jgi:phenylpyruvate tautomerase PptA (4-oxalocrotonate tautomerase family)
MPFIHVRLLPFDESFDVGAVLEDLTKDFAKGTGIGLEHVTAIWEYLPPGYYAVAGKAAQHQPQDSNPVLVDLLAPDFNSAATVEKMLTTVSSSISKRAKVPITNIFINHRQAHSGSVLEAGEIVHW